MSMHGDRNLPAPNSVPVKRQRLGFLPTMALWNDQEMQKLVFPIIVAVSVPLTPLLLYIQHALDLSTWLVMAVTLLYPYLILGLVERHVRTRPRARRVMARSGREHHGRAPSFQYGATLLMGTVSMAIAALLALGAGKAAILITLALGAVGLLGLALRARRALAGGDDKPREALGHGGLHERNRWR